MKDKCIAELQKLEKKQCHPVFWSTEASPKAFHFPQHTAGTSHATVVTAGPQHPRPSPLPPPPHVPPLSPVNDDTIVFRDFGDIPVPPCVVSQSGSPTGVLQDNQTLLRQTAHLDKVTLTWNTRRDSQATQWKTTVLPKLVLVYLANRMETESGRVPPSSKPVHQCQCNKSALKVDLVTWDRKFPALSCGAPAHLHNIRVLAAGHVSLRMLPGQRPIIRNWLLPLCTCLPIACI
jgi:hypothetical protein